MDQRLIKNNFNFWRYLINFWSVLFFVAIVFDFYNFNALEGLLNIFATVYISILAIYVGNKEFDRWYDKHESRHPGEFFVIVWSVLMVFLFILSFVPANDYKIPNSVISSYIAVLTILAVTQKSKEMYKAKRKACKKVK